MTDDNVPLDCKRQNQPDRRVTERVDQLSPDSVTITSIGTRRLDVERLVMGQTQRENEAQVHDVTERQCRQVSVS